MSTTIQDRAGTRRQFTHADVARMTQAFHAAGGGTAGRQAVYKLFTEVENGKLDEKMIELGIVEKPQKPVLSENDRTIAIDAVQAIVNELPPAHRAEAARAIAVALREQYTVRRAK